MRATRLSSQPNGGTQIDDIWLRGNLIDPIRWLGEPIAVTTLRGRRVDALTEQPMHPAPRAQVAVILGGALEVETPSGHTRRFDVGDVVFLEDTSGPGHITRVVKAPATFLEIHLALAAER